MPFPRPAGAAPNYHRWVSGSFPIGRSSAAHLHRPFAFRPVGQSCAGASRDGVCRRGNAFLATISTHRKKHYLGYFQTLSEARAARIAAERLFFGEFRPKLETNKIIARVTSVGHPTTNRELTGRTAVPTGTLPPQACEDIELLSPPSQFSGFGREETPTTHRRARATLVLGLDAVNSRPMPSSPHAQRGRVLAEMARDLRDRDKA